MKIKTESTYGTAVESKLWKSRRPEPNRSAWYRFVEWLGKRLRWKAND